MQQDGISGVIIQREEIQTLESDSQWLGTIHNDHQPQPSRTVHSDSIRIIIVIIHH